MPQSERVSLCNEAGSNIQTPFLPYSLILHISLQSVCKERSSSGGWGMMDPLQGKKLDGCTCTMGLAQHSS